MHFSWPRRSSIHRPSSVPRSASRASRSPFSTLTATLTKRFRNTWPKSSSLRASSATSVPDSPAESLSSVSLPIRPLPLNEETTRTDRGNPPSWAKAFRSPPASPSISPSSTTVTATATTTTTTTTVTSTTPGSSPSSSPEHLHGGTPPPKRQRRHSPSLPPGAPVIPVPRYKVVVVGDGFVGKTCLLHTQAHGEFPRGYAPTVFENYILPLEASGELINPVELSLWDTAGQEDYDRLRPLSYPGASVFLLCYAVDNPVSLRNLSERWIPEVRHHSPRTPIILVGLKGDLRGDPRVNQPMVRVEDVLELSARAGAAGHLECSAWSRQGLSRVFTLAGSISYKEAHRKRWGRREGECRVL